MKERIKKILRLTLGWLLLFLGIVGLFLPFLQGILFILGGLAILSREYTWARRCLVWCRAKFRKKDPSSESNPSENDENLHSPK